MCSVKHQKQLSGGQGPRSEEQFEWTRTAPVAPKSQQDRITEKPGVIPGFLECLPVADFSIGTGSNTSTSLINHPQEA
ncbi:hypothetical protein EMIT0P294_70226 [Pseudomonas sp. IT-P294]